MELLLHNVIFNVLVYIILKFEIILTNDKYPKALWKHYNQYFKTIKRLVNELEFFCKWNIFHKIHI